MTGSVLTLPFQNSHHDGFNSNYLPSASAVDLNVSSVRYNGEKRIKYWWRVIGRALSVMLARSSYTEQARTRYNDFFLSSIAPLLGPSPDEYAPSCLSFMCDDHTPVEIGWVFNSTGDMTVQYAIEVLADDNSPILPFHNIIILHELAASGHCQNFNLSWTYICTKTLLYQSDVLFHQPNLLPPHLQRVSQFFIGINTARDGISLKSYFLPQVRAQVTGVSVMDIVTDTIHHLGLDSPWSKVTSFIATLPDAHHVEPVIVAVDCVADAQNRLKVYIRTQATHLSALCDMITLGGQLTGPPIDSILSKLREIWKALFGSISDSTPVLHKRSNTGPTGFLFYYEMALGKPFPIPKIYIPAARFLDNDAHVAEVMSKFVGSSYHEDLQSIFPGRDLHARSGIHSHIALTAKKGTCQVTSYFNPSENPL